MVVATTPLNEDGVDPWNFQTDMTIQNETP